VLRSEYLRSLSVRSCHSTAFPFLITSFWKFCFRRISVFLFSTLIVLVTILGPLMFVAINYARVVCV